MDFIKYPFKQTEATKIKESFRKHIISHGSEEVFSIVENEFDKINWLRDRLNFSNIDVTNLEATQNLEQTIYKYLRYAMLLQNRFKFQAWHSDRVLIDLVWTDSFKQKDVTKTSNMKVELCAIIYNLAILLYYIGIIYMQKNSNDDRKNAIKKFRQSLWAIAELKSNLPSIIREFRKGHLDFTVQNIVTLDNLLYGLAYTCLFQNLEPSENQIGLQHIASLSGEANKHFQQALKITDDILSDQDTGFSKIFLLQAKQFFYSQTVYNFGVTAIKMAKHHEKLLETQKSVPHLGISIAYIEKAKKILQLASKNQNNISPSLQKGILSITSTVDSMYQTFINLNTSIYKNPIPSEIPTTKLQDNLQIKFLIPSELEAKSEEEMQLQAMLSAEIVEIIREAKKITEDNKKLALDSLNDLKDTQSRKYLNSFVNGYLEIISRQKENSTKRGLPDSVQQKLRQYQARGGEKAIVKTIQVLKENSQSAQELLNEIMNLIKQEEQDDQNNRIQYKEKWDVYPSSVINTSYIQRIKELEENLREGEEVDNASVQAYESLKFFIDILHSGEEYILSLLPKGQDEQFLQTFQTQMLEIQRLDKEFIAIIEASEKKIELITKQLNISEGIAKAKCQSLQKEQIIQVVSQKSVEAANQIINEITRANELVDEICRIAELLNQQKMKQEAQDTIKEIEKLNDGIWRIIELQKELEGGLDFYKRLLNAITDADFQVKDFVTSRQQQKENQLYLFSVEVKKNASVYGSNYVTDQPFFEDGGFPKGRSEYVGQKSLISEKNLTS